VGLAVLVACWFAQLSYTITAVAASAFLYGMGYLIFGVATGMRYYVWTIVGAALAAVLAASELQRRRHGPNRRVTFLAATIVVVPTAMAVSARLFL
jgi:hypothetical protein